MSRWVADTHALLWYLYTDRDTVPDMPDRIIAATALHLNLPLCTRDPRIVSLNLITAM